LDVGGSGDAVTGELTENGTAFAKIEADRALYPDRPNPVFPFRAVPSELLGRYTVVFPIEELQRDPKTFPQGDGVGVMSVRRNGTARFVGELADGTAVSCGNTLSKDNEWPFYVSIDRQSGSISGPVRFEDLPKVSDLGGTLHWLKGPKPKLKRYPNGWLEGLLTKIVGAKFELPPHSSPAAILPGLGPTSTSGNAAVQLSGGVFPNGTQSQRLNIDSDNRVSFVAPIIEHIRLRLNTDCYYMERLQNPAGSGKLTFKGVVLQKQRLGSGYFLDKSESGAVTLAPVAQ